MNTFLPSTKCAAIAAFFYLLNLDDDNAFFQITARTRKDAVIRLHQENHLKKTDGTLLITPQQENLLQGKPIAPSKDQFRSNFSYTTGNTGAAHASQYQC